MKKSWIIGIIIVLIYMAAALGASWYYSFPTLTERQAVHILPKVVNANPITDEAMKQMSERQKYGDWPIQISDERLGRANPFRIK
ncbi:MAG: hypothetical protein WC570_00960 [Patescibacteria group bacterium]